MEEEIEELLKRKDDYDFAYGTQIYRPYTMSEKDWELIENLLTRYKQQTAELENKDKEYEELTEASKELCKTVNLMKKVINEMAEYIDKITFVDEKEDYGCDFQLLTNVMCNHNNCKECIKEYFTNEVEREGK